MKQLRRFQTILIRKQVLIPFFILLFLIVGTAGIVLYGRGYRLGFDNGKPKIKGTGLLVATSTPDGASVFVNGHLTTATDNTINLAPGEYSVRIFKEGYLAWEKKLIIQEEVVTQADALLFPTAPKLENITAIGVQNPTIDPSSTRIAYTVASQSARKNGIYVLDMNTRLLTLQSSSQQIADDTVDLFSSADIFWSPDGKTILASISASLTTPTYYLLNASSYNAEPQDITTTLLNTEISWNEERLTKEQARTAGLKRNLQNMISDYFTIIAWSPDENKILYQASNSAALPLIITPRRLGIDKQREDRKIEKDLVYVYDIKEDVNFKINTGNMKLPSIQALAESGISNPQRLHPLRWFPDSSHLIFVHDKKIDILEYDGSNATTIYAGPFIENYVFPWTNASKIVILTNFGNPAIFPNLYTIGLK